MKRCMGLLLGVLLAVFVVGMAQAEDYKDLGQVTQSTNKFTGVGQYNQVRLHNDSPCAMEIAVSTSVVNAGYKVTITKPGTECRRSAAAASVNGQDYTTTLRALLDMGDYVILLEPDEKAPNWQGVSEISVSIYKSAATYTDTEPNDTRVDAPLMQAPFQVKGALCFADVDGARFEVAQPGVASISAKLELARRLSTADPFIAVPRMEILDSQDKIVFSKALSDDDTVTYLIKNKSFDLTVSLEPGEYWLRMTQGTASPGYYYSVNLYEHPKLVSFGMPKTKVLTVGFVHEPPITCQPAGALPYGLIWSSSKPKIASVSEMGEISCHKKGTTTIKVASADGKVKASCKVTVKPNVYSISKPKRPKKKGLYIITKKLKYVSTDTIEVEAFVYNRLGIAIPYRALNGLYASVYSQYDDKNAIGQTYVANWRKSGSIRNGRYGVIKYKVKSVYNAKFDLRNGSFYAMLEGDDDYDFDYDDDYET